MILPKGDEMKLCRDWFAEAFKGLSPSQVILRNDDLGHHLESPTTGAIVFRYKNNVLNDAPLE